MIIQEILTDNHLDKYTNFIDKKYYSLDNKTKVRYYVNSSFYSILKTLSMVFLKKK